MEKKALDDFLGRYIAKQHTEKEHQEFIDWLKKAPIEQIDYLFSKYGNYFEDELYQEPGKYKSLIAKIESGIDSENQNKVVGSILFWSKFKIAIAIASAVILISSISLYFLKRPVKDNFTANNLQRKPILPGTNKAILTLANGTQILLDDSNNGVISKQNNIVVKKTKNGQLVYTIEDIKTADGKDDVPAFNTISTPKGGQYQVILPDESQVWLNAASSLKFPTFFKGTARNVELTGEAYFEIAKNKAMPFKVAVNNMNVEVLGTHFNIMAYTDENSTKTTLLEGSVKVTKGGDSKVITPGQQANVQEKIKVSNVDAAQAVEWKNGNFNFSHEDIKTIMRKVARWYNVEISYEGTVTKEGFVGVIPRSENISEVLNALELTGLVHFKIQERRVLVMP